MVEVYRAAVRSHGSEPAARVAGFSTGRRGVKSGAPHLVQKRNHAVIRAVGGHCAAGRVLGDPAVRLQPTLDARAATQTHAALGDPTIRSVPTFKRHGLEEPPSVGHPSFLACPTIIVRAPVDADSPRREFSPLGGPTLSLPRFKRFGTVHAPV